MLHPHQLLLDRRGKRKCMEEPSEALARALLETVRQALDDTGVGDADDDALTAAASHTTRGGHPTGRRAPRKNSFPRAESPIRPPGLIDQQIPDPDQDPIAYVVRVDGSQRHDAATKRVRNWHAQLPGPAEEPPPPRQHGLAYSPAFKMAWMQDPAGVLAAFQPGLLDQDVQEALVAAGLLNHHHHPQHYHHPHVETGSHGSTHTYLEAGDAGELGGGGGRDAGPVGDHQADFGVVDRSEPTSTDDGNEGPVHRKKQASPKAGIPGGPCAHCGTTESPQWRRPLTKKVVLCNACGIYFSRHHSLPKRKKLAGGASQVIGRSGKAAAASAQPAKQPQQPSSIICEEELEVEENGGLGAAAYGADATTTTGAAVQCSLPSRTGEALPVSFAPWGQQLGAQTDGLVSRAHQPLRERGMLSVPLMTAFPVAGGINAVVQTYLNPSLAGR